MIISFQIYFSNQYIYIFTYLAFICMAFNNIFIKWHHFNMEQYIPYSLICDLFSRNLETYLQI